MTPRLAALAAVLLLAAGCSGDGDPGAQPTEPTTAENAAATEPTEEPSETPAETGDPLSFTSSGRLVIGCFPRGFRQMVIFDTVLTDRDVTLTGITTDSSALRITDTYVTSLPRKAVTEGGLFDLRPDSVMVDDILAWADREPLEDARLEPGTRYTFMAVTRVVPDRTLDDLELGWDDGETRGTSAYDFRGRTKTGGC